MKNILMILTVIVLIVASVGYTQSASTITKGRPMAVQDTGMTDFIAVSTKNLLDTPTLVGTLPNGTVALWVTSASGAFAYGDASLATATVANYPAVADGSEKRFVIFPGEKNPIIYLLNSSAGATSSVSLMAEVQR